MSELLIPKPQPNFPHEDVNETNAQLFGQLLLDPEYIFKMHGFAEDYVEAFRVGHSTIKSLGYVMNGSHQQTHSLSFGATIYEALSMTVHPTERQVASSAQVGRVANKLFLLRDSSLDMMVHILDEEERFTEEMPLTTELVELSTELSPTLDKRIVLWGAALERSIERDTTDAVA